MANVDLRKERLDRGWTLEDLACELAQQGAEAHITTLAKIERRIQVPRPRLRKALADLYGVDVREFDKAST